MTTNFKIPLALVQTLLTNKMTYDLLYTGEFLKRLRRFSPLILLVQLPFLVHTQPEVGTATFPHERACSEGQCNTSTDPSAPPSFHSRTVIP